MTKQEFKTTLIQSGTQVRLPVPFDPNGAWGEKERHHIRGTVNGMGFRGPLASDESGFFLVLGAAWRRDCGLKAGDAVDVVLEPEGPQFDSLSPDIAEALAAEPEARAFFDSLATFYRKGYLRWIEGAKRPETREKRIRETIELLMAGKKQR